VREIVDRLLARKLAENQSGRIPWDDPQEDE
jgi:hypothetical protein